MRTRELIIVLFIFSTTFTHAQTNKLHFDRYNTSNGLSNNRVYSILQDKQGFLWFGTLDGLNRFDGYSFSIYRNIPLDSLSLQSNRIISMFEDSSGNIWLFTKKNGVNRFDPKTEKFYHYKSIKGTNTNLYNIEIERVKETKNKIICMYSGNMLFKYTPTTDDFSFVSINDSNIVKNQGQKQSIIKTIKVNYGLDVEITHIISEHNFNWIATKRNGLFLLEKKANSIDIKKYDQPPFDNAEIKCLYKDHSGIVWIGTKNKGVFKHNPLTRNFIHYNAFNSNESELKEETIRAITSDKEGNLWLGTYNEGLIKFNLNTNKTTTYKHIPGNKSSLSNNMVRTLYTDINGTIWVGTYSGVSKYNPINDSFKNYLPVNADETPTDVSDSSHIYYNRVYGFDNDFFGNLWIANWKGLSKLNPKTNTFKHYPSSFFGLDNIREVYVDKNNIIWIGAEFGGLVKFNSLNENFERYSPSKDINSLAHQNVFAIHESSDNKLYISTFNGLSVLNKQTGNFKRLTASDGLGSNMIYGILEDKLGQIWLTTTNGLSVLNPKNNSITTYTENIGLQNNEFTEGAYYYCEQRNEMIIGGINGINIFNPDKIQEDTITPQVVITSLLLSQKPVDINYKEHILDKVINYTSEISLKPSHKVITFEFTALHFAIPQQNQYKYKLEGFDKDWVNTNSGRRYATYTNLKPGKYIFKVLASNNDGVWSKKPTTIKVTILPPYWQTWWAFLIYVVIVVILMLVFRHYSIRSMQMKSALKLERIKREKSDEIHQMKLNFFTNISHEYRSPLSLIIEPIDDILQSNPNTTISDCLEQLKLIQNNSKKMLHLTNQILDLRKIEMGKMKILVSKTSLGEFINDVLINYKELAVHKNIKLNYKAPTEPIWAWIDRTKFEQILSNLFSNAMKYSHPDKGLIDISLSLEKEFSYNQAFILGQIPKNKFALITIKDNGIGIPQDYIEKIFQQFYRVDSAFSLTVQGSGLGLALVKDLIELHHGAIAVKSKEEKGSTFYLLVPIGLKHFNKSEIKEISDIHKEANDKSLQLMTSDIFTPELAEYNYDINKKTILLVEDNPELLNYTAKILSDEYNILQATDGAMGIEMAFKKLPDIIISDIMMPKKTGVELCQILKNDIKTSHIIIILLTAKTAEEHLIEGYLNKSDDYIIKPINKKLLKIRIRNLLENRELLINNIDNIKKQGKILNNISPLDKDFLERINEIVTLNISNVDFNVEKLSNEMGMSRSNLHIKLKALTQQSASDYIRGLRLNQASTLLREQKKNINEICYEVGFNTPSYFIKCFKDKYGITPKEYCQI